MKEPNILDKKANDNLIKSFKNNANIAEEQADILAEASKNFVIDINDNKGISSIGLKNTENPQKKNTTETKTFFENAFNKIKETREIEIQDVLNLMPKISTLSINPYTTAKDNDNKSKLLYSISSEWYDKDGKQWEFRTHSTDLNFANKTKAKWIFRLGYGDQNAKLAEKFYYNGKDFDKDRYTDENAHIAIKQIPFENKHLLSNAHFQNLMSQISCQYGNKQSTKFIAEKLGCAANEDTILDICRKDITKYLQNKLYIDNLCEKRGLPLLDER